MPAEQLTPDRTREASVVCDVVGGGGPAGSAVSALAARDWNVIHSPRRLASSPASAA